MYEREQDMERLFARRHARTLTVYECLKESEDSSTFLVKETATGILCVLKWGRNRQAEFLRNEMEIMKKWRIGNCPGFQRHTGYLKKMAKCIW